MCLICRYGCRPVPNSFNNVMAPILPNAGFSLLCFIKYPKIQNLFMSRQCNGNLKWMFLRYKIGCKTGSKLIEISAFSLPSLQTGIFKTRYWPGINFFHTFTSLCLIIDTEKLTENQSKWQIIFTNINLPQKQYSNKDINNPPLNPQN